MRNSKIKTHNLYKIVFLLIVFLGIGYAFLEVGLNINGDTTVAQPEFNTYVQSVSITTGSTSGTPTIIGNDKKEVDFSTALTNDVNSFFEETSTLVNKGSKKSYLQSIDVKVYDSNNNEITLAAPYEYSLTHGDGTSITPGEELASAATTTYKLKFNYISGTDMNTVTDYPVYTFKITYNFTANSFADDDWDTIATKVTANPSAYPLGATKTIEMDLDGDNTNETYTLRVVNNTTPAECSTTGFSESACGFVVEFADIIDTHIFNPHGDYTLNGYDNTGGWATSDVRAYLNGARYAASNTDYTDNGVYQKLPSALKNKILTTTVKSGHGYYNGTSNYTTTDKLYLLSVKEIFGDPSPNTSVNYDSAKDSTRQLDYYASKNITSSNLSPVDKKINGTSKEWWTRSPKSNAYGSVYVADASTYGDVERSAYNSMGVSPAFKIGLNN